MSLLEEQGAGTKECPSRMPVRSSKGRKPGALHRVQGRRPASLVAKVAQEMGWWLHSSLEKGAGGGFLPEEGGAGTKECPSRMPVCHSKG